MTLDPFTRSPESIVHARILQTEARIQNNRVLSNNLLQPKSPVKNPSRKEIEDPQHMAEPKELEVNCRQEHKKAPDHHDQYDNLHQLVPTRMISSVNVEHDDLQGEQSNDSEFALLKDKKAELTRPKDHSVTNSEVCDSSDASSISSSRARLARLGALVNRARGNRRTAPTRPSSLVGDESMVESKTTEEIRLLLQENKDRPMYQHSYVITEDTNRNNGSEHEEYDRFHELCRLKARLEMVRNEKTSKTPSHLGRSVNRNTTDNWMVDSPPPSPPPSPATKQARNSEPFLNRLLSKEAHYIKTAYEESESKTDDLGITVESRLCSHYMAIQQNEVGANDVLLEEDPMIRLIYLAKQLADHASQVDFIQRHDEHLTRMNSLPRLPLSTVSHNSMIFHNQEKLTSLDPSMDNPHSPPALNNQTSGTLPPFEYLLKKLQAAEEECMELTRSKETLEASLTAANNVRRYMEVSVQSLKEELEAAQATNRLLSEELDSTKKEIATLTNSNEKLEGELERTQNRLGDVAVHVADLELVGASLRQMVQEKDKEIDENMVLFTDQHKSVVSVLDDVRVFRHQMANMKEKLQPTSEEDSEGEDGPGRRAQELWDDWLKEALPRLDAMDMALSTFQSQLAVKVKRSDDDDKDDHDKEAAKVRWSLFQLRR